MTYEKTVAAALAETKSKFGLAEALALDVPPRPRGGSAENDQSVTAYLEQARQAIIDAGGEPRSTLTLRDLRATALWVSSGSGNTTTFNWIPGVSLTAHSEARGVGMSYEEFAANPRSSQKIREEYGKADKTAGPERIAKSWTPEQRASVARELLADPEVAEAVEDDIVQHVASDPVRTAHVISHRRDADPRVQHVERPDEQRPRRDYDAMVEQWVNLASVTFAAESSGTWQPNEHSEALLYFISQIIGKRNEPTGENAEFVNAKLENLFSEVEAYANSEIS